jgi:hypothetical protein
MAAPRFCNVDLDVEFKSKDDLKALKAELGRKAVVLVGGPVSPGGCLLRLEIDRDCDNPDDAIGAFCSLLENLSAKGRGAWRSAHKKEFDVGYEADLSQRASQFSLCNNTIKRVADLGATLGVTLYHLHEDAAKAAAKTVPPTRKKK